MKTPQQLNLPRKFKNWRPGQGELVEQIANSPKKVFLLDAPAGTGKSLVAIAVHQTTQHSTTAKEVLARLAGKSPKDYDRQTIFLCRTKQMQDQICEEFPKAKTVKGRSNYPCLKHEQMFPEYTAEDCTFNVDPTCHYRFRFDDEQRRCPYFYEKELAIASPLAVLNTSYFLTEVNGVGMFSGADFLVIDEFDQLESELLNQIQLKITTRQLKRLGLEQPKDSHSLQGWLVWANQLTCWTEENKIQQHLQSVPESEWSDIEIEMHKQANRLRNFQSKISTFTLEVNDSWIFTEKQDEKTKEIIWEFKPVRVEVYAERYLWRHAKRFLGMSGTILDPEIMADDLGIKDWDYAQSACPFPLANRPIYYNPVVNLRMENMATELPKLAEAVDNIMERYPKDKVLVHTTSFVIQDYLQRNLNGTRVMTHNSQNRAEMLELFKKSQDPVAMLSPSFDRGVNLIDNLCRCVIICKVPYINLGDPQVKARMKMPGGEKWYLLKAAQSIMQMSGRGVRSDQDFCNTFILDRQFTTLMNRMGRYFPQWWKDAIIRR